MEKSKIGLCLLTLISGVAYADSGLFVGVGAGYGSIATTTTGGYNYPNGSSSNNGGNMAGSVYVGYDFSHYVGVQLDYDYFVGSQYNAGGSATPGVSTSFNTRQQIIDLGITGHLPFSLFANALSGISLFGKLAFGYSTVSFNGGTLVNNNIAVGATNLPGSSSSLVPVIGGGAEYGIGPVGIRLEYDYIGNSTVNVGGQNMMNVNNNLVLLSALYHF